MGTAHANIWFRNVNCELLTSVWRTDLVIQACSGGYLVDVFPEIIEQLKKKYAKPGKVSTVTNFPLSDQATKVLGLQIGGGSVQNLTFTTPATTLVQIYAQMKAFFTDCEIYLEEGQIVVETTDRGPDATIVISGDCELVWGPVEDGSGYEIESHYYQGAKRIMLMPPSGQFVNHVEVDIPPGCYKIWTRVCHGNNEETSVVMTAVRCGEEACINLLLPTVKTCAAQVMHPLMDKIVYEGALNGDDNRLIAFQGVMFGAQVGKQEVIAQLNQRLEEAQAKDDGGVLEARVNAVIALANQLPECQ